MMIASAACGSDDDGGSGSTDEGAVESTGDDAAMTTDGSDEEDTAGDDRAETESESESESESDGADDSASISAGAVVTVGDEQFVFDQEVVCVALGGAVGASFLSTSDDTSFDVDLPPQDWEDRSADEGWEAPSVRLDDDRVDVPVSWRAGGDVLAGMTDVPTEVEVTSFVVGDGTGSGTAVVVDVNSVMLGAPVVTDMAFEFNCS